MSKVLEWLVGMSVTTTIALGIVVLVYVISFIWAHIFALLLTLFRVKKDFILWLREKYSHKEYSPESDEEKEERKKRLSRKKGAE